MDTGIKNIKLSRKIFYFASANGRTLTRGVSLLEYRVNVLGFFLSKEEGRKSAEYFVKVTAFPKARLYVCARSVVSS